MMPSEPWPCGPVCLIEDNLEHREHPWAVHSMPCLEPAHSNSQWRRRGGSSYCSRYLVLLALADTITRLTATLAGRGREQLGKPTSWDGHVSRRPGADARESIVRASGPRRASSHGLTETQTPRQRSRDRRTEGLSWQITPKPPRPKAQPSRTTWQGQGPRTVPRPAASGWGLERSPPGQPFSGRLPKRAVVPDGPAAGFDHAQEHDTVCANNTQS